jgi:hypothetical protein
MRAIAFHYPSPAAAFSTLPQDTTALSGTEFTTAIAIYMGLPDPQVVAAKEAMGNPEFFQDRGDMRRLFDTYGNSLSNYMGSGHLRTANHNYIQHELYYLATTVGMPMQETPTDLFIRDIVQHNQHRYRMQANDRRQRDERFKGGIVPDLFNTQSRTMYDIKTSGHNDDQYYRRQSVVDIKAALVPGEYVRRARDVDQTFNETTEADRPGPVESRLASMKEVVCVSVGAFGEVNRATSDLLSQIAEQGSKRPERFGCCHGPEQAKGVIAQWAMRRFGRVCIRGAARVRHGALAAIMEKARPDQNRPRSNAREGMPWNEWDSGNTVWVPGN